MRKNEYTELSDFLSEYTGKRDPANNKWYGLEFKYDGLYYRLDYSSDTILLFKLLFENGNRYPAPSNYDAIGQYNNMVELLECTICDNKKFKDIIIDESTELLSKD